MLFTIVNVCKNSQHIQEENCLPNLTSFIYFARKRWKKLVYICAEESLRETYKGFVALHTIPRYHIIGNY